MSNVPVIPPPPAGLAYIAVIQPSISLLIITVFFLGMFVPLLMTLFFLSSRDLRRKPIFTLSVLIVALGMVQASLSIWAQVSTILRPTEENNSVIVDAVVCTLAPILIETVLFVRLLAVYPFSRISMMAKFAVYGFPVAMRTARVVNTAIGLQKAIKIFRESPSAISGPEQVWHQSFTKVECILQVIDNTYISVLFLRKLHQAHKASVSFKIRSSRSYSMTLRTLMWIVASNFVIPDVLSLAQLIVLALGQRYNVDIYVFALFFINPCVEIISVLFATVWAAKNHWQPHEASQPPTFSLGLESHAPHNPTENAEFHGVTHTTSCDEHSGGHSNPSSPHIQDLLEKKPSFSGGAIHEPF